MRRLSLHASALSDSEYALFTKSLEEIVDDHNHDAADDLHYEQLVVGIREARAWLRGRYSHISAANIDAVLKLFCPKLAASDTITGGEFFAALRLVIHAENGKEIDRSLAFAQVDPISRVGSPSKGSNVSTSTSPVRHTQPDSISRTPVPHNPFARGSTGSHHPMPSGPPVHPSHRSDSSRTIASSSQRSSHNPFYSSTPHSDDGSGSTKLPPLPPRKPIAGHSPHASLPAPAWNNYLPPERLERSLSPTKRSPPVPPKPASHVTSNLIKQSLTASKVAQSMKKAEEQLEKERVMQVLKSSSVVSGTNIHNSQQAPSGTRQLRSASQRHTGPPSSESSTSDGSTGPNRRPNAPPLPKRRSTQQPPPSQQPSPPLSASSLEQVALATTSDRHHQRERAEHHDHVPPVPPPTHPDRKPHLGYHQLPPPPSPTSSTPTPGPSDLKRAKNLETFEAIYGSMTATSGISPQPSNDPGYFAANSKSAVISPALETSVEPDSPSARVFRSKSLNQTAKPFAPPVPPPPIRKRRPESVQILGSQTDIGDESVARNIVIGTHRRSSLSISTSNPSSLTRINSTTHGGGLSTASTASTTSSSGLGGNIQRTIDALHSIHDQLQPKFEKARYKAEAGLSRRGYVRGLSHGERSSPTRVEEREESEALTHDGVGSRRESKRRSTKDRWQDGYIRSNPDSAGEDEDRDRDERWRTEERRYVPPASIGSVDAARYTKTRPRPRHVFDDSPERDDFDTRDDIRSNSTSGWTPL